MGTPQNRLFSSLLHFPGFGVGVDISVSKIFNPIALRKTKIACNFGLSECSRVKFYV